jgi:hypothetical protein
MDRVHESLDIVKRAKALGDYDSNVIGMAAEIIAEDVLGMRKAATGNKDIEGYFFEGDEKVSVQVKAFSSGRILKYKGAAKFRIPENGSDKLIVIVLYSNLAEYEIIYNGDAKLAGKKKKKIRERI